MRVSSYHHEVGASRPRFTVRRLTVVAVTALLASLLASVPADARKRAKRSNYAPPPAAMVVDAYTGKVLYEENANKPRFPASVTKVMTLYLLFEALRDGDMRPDTQLKVSEAASDQAPSKLGLEPGSTIAVRDAMYALVTKSANDAAAVIAENIAGSEPAFARMMTLKARSLGMTNTTFRNASGLPDPNQTTTARDLVTLGRRILADFPEQSKIFSTRFYQYGKARLKNHNGLLFSYAGTEGLKTGYTRDSGFNLLTSCRRQDKHLVAVVLGGRSSADRNARMRGLLDGNWRKAVAYNDIRQQTPAKLAGGAASSDMPERNRALQSSVSERTLSIALDTARETEGSRAQKSDVPEKVAVASVANGPVAEASNDEDEAEEHAADEGDTATEVAAAVQTQVAAVREVAAPVQTPEQQQLALGPYHVQVGSYLDIAGAKGRLADVAEKASDLLGGHGLLTVPGEVRGKAYFRARFGSFSEDGAASTCSKLKRMKIDCLVVHAE
jgi:D-alanyl-D-alanine carboxypeptidase